MSLNVLGLFSGIGGLELGLERAGMRTVGQVEIDQYCRRVLAKHWPNVPRHDDVKTAADWWLNQERPTVDVICGGFPCQDISSAGRRSGIIDGERSSLWSFMADTVRRVRPRYVLVENVPRILVRGRDGFIPVEIVAADLAAIGYDLRWDCVPAAALGAPHRRDRWFGIAYANSEQLWVESIRQPWGQRPPVDRDDGQARALADASSSRRQDEPRRGDEPGIEVRTIADASGRTRSGDAAARDNQLGRSVSLMATPLANTDGQGLPDGHAEQSGPDGWGERPERRGGGRDGGQWATEPAVGRVVDGLSNRVDRAARISALGNAVVPQVAEYVGRLIVEHEARAAA